jgi:hypothetical protein
MEVKKMAVRKRKRRNRFEPWINNNSMKTAIHQQQSVWNSRKQKTFSTDADLSKDNRFLQLLISRREENAQEDTIEQFEEKEIVLKRDTPIELIKNVMDKDEVNSDETATKTNINEEIPENKDKSLNQIENDKQSKKLQHLKNSNDEKKVTIPKKDTNSQIDFDTSRPSYNKDPYYSARKSQKGVDCDIREKKPIFSEGNREKADTHSSSKQYKYHDNKNIIKEETNMSQHDDNCLDPQQVDCGLVDSTVQGDCTNDNLLPFQPESNIIKVPRVLYEPEIQVCVEADINLPERALEIKRILKDVFLTQCKLVPTRFFPGTSYVMRGKLYVAGFIRKNIEYATAGDAGTNARCGDIRHTTVKVPFSCCTQLDFPSLTQAPLITVTDSQVSNFLRDDGMGPRLDKKLFRNFATYNEQPFCELVRARFHELDFVTDNMMMVTDDLIETPFERFREKIVLELTVKLLQVQQVQVPLVPVPPLNGSLPTPLALQEKSKPESKSK